MNATRDFKTYLSRWAFVLRDLSHFYEGNEAPSDNNVDGRECLRYIDQFNQSVYRKYIHAS